MSIENITNELDKFRQKNGIQWKSKLKELYFTNQNRNPELQYFRNHFDFETLDKIKYHTTKREIKQILENYT